ncbi:hypothetical protein ITP53_28585 [Nonomuraea sp. K274]|uniref:Uncharacterized protein n=1 Tax=Nonomuraea cypriaca TaxID=1187855 RepID=A0A931F3C9_9ACTN|nr:hypothetical protein [Nonomuraea cypriaca]MBF8189623.1 hypothetical protein [Nonomuraea cypriaca]
MNDTGKVALALVAGYYLGRRQKLRLALALATAGVTRKMRRDGGGLLQQGSKVLSASPEVADMTDRLKGEVLQVAKAAAVSAASRQIDSLTTKLREGSETRRQPAAEEQAPEEAEPETDQYAEQEQDKYAEEAPRARVPEPRMSKVAEDLRTRRPGAARRQSSISSRTEE